MTEPEILREQHYDVHLTFDVSDRAYAQRLAEEFEQVGLCVWQECESLNQECLEYLMTHLGIGLVQVVIWSKDSTASGRIQAEARIGSQKGQLIAARIEKVLPPRDTEAFAYVDLCDWRGGSEHPGLRKLLGAIHDLTGKGRRLDQAPPPVPASGQPALAFGSLSREEQDEHAWQVACSHDNKTYYQHYLNRIPWGQYREEAESRIAKKRNLVRIIWGCAIGFWALYLVVYVLLVLA